LASAGSTTPRPPGPAHFLASHSCSRRPSLRSGGGAGGGGGSGRVADTAGAAGFEWDLLCRCVVSGVALRSARTLLILECVVLHLVLRKSCLLPPRQLLPLAAQALLDHLRTWMQLPGLTPVGRPHRPGTTPLMELRSCSAKPLMLAAGSRAKRAPERHWCWTCSH